MPRRSNEFQRLVLIIEQAAAPDGFTVDESVMVTDPDTGEAREIDIVVRGEVGAHSFSMGIEAIGRGRPATVEWVEQMVGKHLHLRHVDKLVLVSQSGFRKSASEKAKSLNVETLTFKEALQQDWTSELDRLKVAEQRQLFLPIPVNIGLELEQPPPPGAFSRDWNPPLETADGAPAFTAGDWAWFLVKNQQVAEFLTENSKRDSSTLRLVMTLKFEDFFVRDQLGGRHKLRSMLVDALAHTEVARVPLERHSFGPLQVAIGSADVLGYQFQAAAVQRPKEPIQVRWDVPVQIQLQLRAPELTSPVATKQLSLAELKPI